MEKAEKPDERRERPPAGKGRNDPSCLWRRVFLLSSLQTVLFLPEDQLAVGFLHAAGSGRGDLRRCLLSPSVCTPLPLHKKHRRRR